MRRTALGFLLLAAAPLMAGPTTLPDGDPIALAGGALGLDPARLARLDQAVKEAVTAGQAPGAVVLVVKDGRVVLRRAHGLLFAGPPAEPMTTDAVFDLASLTKPLATGLCVMRLAEAGKLATTDPVVRHLPGFTGQGKEKITLEHLLLHTSGLPAGTPVGDYQGGLDRALTRLAALRPATAPGEKFVYSDVNFILLGAVVEKVAGQPLDLEFRDRIAAPAGLDTLTFLPLAPAARIPAARLVPTEKDGEDWLRGKVHDPRARALGGVAGHAGLFGTADDVAVVAQMLLDGGTVAGRKVLSAETVRRVTTPRPVPGGQRTLGWDVRTGFSAPRGEPDGPALEGFGHTGFTGTSVWADPTSRLVVVLLTSRLQAGGRGNVTALRRRVGALAASAVIAPPFPGGKPAR